MTCDHFSFPRTPPALPALVWSSLCVPAVPAAVLAFVVFASAPIFLSGDRLMLSNLCRCHLHLLPVNPSPCVPPLLLLSLYKSLWAALPVDLSSSRPHSCSSSSCSMSCVQLHLLSLLRAAAVALAVDGRCSSTTFHQQQQLPLSFGAARLLAGVVISAAVTPASIGVACVSVGVVAFVSMLPAVTNLYQPQLCCVPPFAPSRYVFSCRAFI